MVPAARTCRSRPGVRRTDARMPGERHLTTPAEYADAVVGAGLGRWEGDGGFRQPRPGDGLHGSIVVEPLGERVDGTRPVGKDIGLQITAHQGGGMAGFD